MNDGFFEHDPEEFPSDKKDNKNTSYSPYDEQDNSSSGNTPDPYATFRGTHQGTSYASSQWGEERYISNEPPTNGIAIAAFVFSLLGLFSCCCCFFSVPCLIIAVILAFFSKKDVPRMCAMAKASIVLSIIGTILSVAMILYVLAIISSPEFQEEYKQMMESISAEMSVPYELIRGWFRY